VIFGLGWVGVGVLGWLGLGIGNDQQGKGTARRHGHGERDEVIDEEERNRR